MLSAFHNARHSIKCYTKLPMIWFDLIDFVIVKQRHIQDTRITCAMHGAECWTNHRLVISVLKLYIAPTQCKCPKVIRSPFNMAWLRHPYHYSRFWKTLNEKLKTSAPHAEAILRSGASLRRSSLKQQKLSWVLRNMNIRIGSMRMMSVTLSCYMQRTRPMWNGKMTQAPNPRQTNSDFSEDKPRRDYARWKTIGWTESLQTQTIPNNSSDLWRMYIGPHNLDSPFTIS